MVLDVVKLIGLYYNNHFFQLVTELQTCYSYVAHQKRQHVGLD